MGIHAVRRDVSRKLDCTSSLTPAQHQDTNLQNRSIQQRHVLLNCLFPSDNRQLVWGSCKGGKGCGTSPSGVQVGHNCNEHQKIVPLACIQGVALSSLCAAIPVFDVTVDYEETDNMYTSTKAQTGYDTINFRTQLPNQPMGYIYCDR